MGIFKRKINEFKNLEEFNLSALEESSLYHLADRLVIPLRIKDAHKSMGILFHTYAASMVACEREVSVDMV